MGRGKAADGRTASVLGLRAVLGYARTRGVDADALLAELGIPRNALSDVNFRIPEELRARAWREAAARSKDPAFGLGVANHSVPGAYDALDYALCASDTVGDALGRIARFHRLLADALAVTIVTGRGTTQFRRLDLRTPPEEAECFFAVVAERATKLTGGKCRPVRVRFAHRAPRSTRVYQETFHCPVEFGAQSAELVFNESDMRLPTVQRSPGLAAVLDRHMEDLLARLPSDHSYAERVRVAVAQALRGGVPTLETIARALHSSPRTVQRRLQDMGTTHRDIVDDVRRDLASRYMAKPDVSVSDAAFLLGFSEPSGFRRAFKRWTGKSPTSSHAVVRR